MERRIHAGFIDMVLATYDEMPPPEQFRELRNTFFAGASYIARVIYESKFDRAVMVALSAELREFSNTLEAELPTEGST